jgi:iron complex transport system ATP-binding protein
MTGLTVSGLRAGYGGAPVLQNVSFQLENGRIMGVLGANGSGKTTLLKAICGILPHEGSCLLNGQPLEGLNARRMALQCSYIPQRSGISIDVSALDVVLMGFNPQLRLLQPPDAAMRRRAADALAQVGLGDRQEEDYLHLSEGQKQLCILARTLVSPGRLLLMDEPESALDFQHRYRLLQIIRQQVQAEGRMALISLHDPVLALNCCDDLLLIKDGTATGILHPAADSAENMAALLSQIYGPVTLTALNDRQGRRHLVMLKEQEDEP